MVSWREKRKLGSLSTAVEYSSQKSALCLSLSLSLHLLLLSSKPSNMVINARGCQRKGGLSPCSFSFSFT